MPEKLDWFTIEKKHVRELKEQDKPYYTECEKRIIAYSLAFEGTVTIDDKEDRYYQPSIHLANTEFDLLDNFVKIVKLGFTFIDKRLKIKGWKDAKVWKVASFNEAVYILEQLKGYMPCEKYRKLRTLVTEFCISRIEAHSKGERKIPYTKRELEIVKEVHKLNERGRK